jgi:DNA-binding NarL/FixJ family response regulator
MTYETGRRTTRILIADDQPLIRRGLEELFSEYKEFRVVAGATNDTEIVPLVRKLNPDLLITDIRMNGESTLDKVAQVARRFPTTNVLIFSLHTEASVVYAAMRSGARGFAVKNCSCSELLEAARTVNSGRRYFSQEIDHRAARQRLDQERKAAEARIEIRPDEALTNREQEVLELVTQGLTSKEIALRLGIGRRTVESHSGNLLSKLGVRNKAQLVRRAITERMVPV